MYMTKKNPILRMMFDEDEAVTFNNLVPLIHITISKNDANLVSRLLNFKSADDLVKNGFPQNPSLTGAFTVLSFMCLIKENKDTLNDFWKKILFTDKDVERKARRTFNIIDDPKSITANELQLMWMLDTTKDEWDDTN